MTALARTASTAGPRLDRRAAGARLCGRRTGAARGRHGFWLRAVARLPSPSRCRSASGSASRRPTPRSRRGTSTSWRTAAGYPKVRAHRQPGRRSTRASARRATGRQARAGLVGTQPGGGPPFGPAYEEWRDERPDVPFTVGNYWPYATTLFDYIRRAMPTSAPGSLDTDQVYGLVAWLLAQNEIIGESDVMNAETLPAVRCPRGTSS